MRQHHEAVRVHRADLRPPALVIDAVRIRIVPIELRKVLWRQLLARAQGIRFFIPVLRPPGVVAARPQLCARPGVQQQFGQAIEQAVRDVLCGQGVTGARVRLTDRGALECVIRARVETAVRRGKESA